MQTPSAFLHHPTRLAAAALALMLAVLPAACTTPRVEGRAESEHSADVCTTLDTRAKAISARADADGTPTLVRYTASDEASHAWLDVAIQCPTHFAEGTLRSAQAQYDARNLARSLGIGYEPLTVTRLDDVDTLTIGGDTLARIALAEDRAGFATEVLAGRFTDGVADDARTAALTADGDLLAMSNDHKETASRLMHLSNGAKDLRRKVYATEELTKDSATAIDPATGLRANTVAVLEIDCARDELTAFDESAHIDDATMNDEERAQMDAALLQLSMLIATHAYTAFALGYPSTDAALFA